MGWIEDIIVAEGGAISFARYMELALYEPVNGYYSGPDPRYGRSGDFLTAPTASEWYGRVVASLLGRIADRTGPLTLVDLAAGDGSFLKSVVRALGDRTPRPLASIVAVERSPARRSAIREAGLDAVVAERIEEVPDPPGPTIVHASELYDALPVERVIGTADGLEEFWVRVADGGLEWDRRPARPEIESILRSQGVALEPDQIAEVCLSASALHRRHLEWAGSDGLMVILDYGYPAFRLYGPRGRGQGSLVCYSRHRFSRDPLERPGEQDITAHVNWDDLDRAGDEAGWSRLALWPLAEFLVRAGLERVAEAEGLGMEAPLDARTVAERQEIKRLLDPEGMGSDLKVLLQGRGCLARLPEAAEPPPR